MKKLMAVVIVLLAVLPAPVFAQNIFLSIETKLAADGSAHTAVSMTLDAPNPQLIIPIFDKYRNLRWESNFPDFNCNEVSKSYGIDVVCDASGVSRSGTFKIEYDTSDFVTKSENTFLFNQRIVFPVNASVFQLRTILPDGYGLVKDDPAFLPSDGSSSTDGRNIFVFWSRTNVKAGDLFTSQITYESLGIPVDILSIGSGIALLLGLLVFGYMRRSGVKPQTIYSVLRSDEKLVLEKIVDNKGEVNQKVIVRESGYSKAKVSKILNSLADRGIVKLERLGRSNKIYLQSNFKLKPQKRSGND